jgi:hypothetical protein
VRTYGFDSIVAEAVLAAGSEPQDMALQCLALCCLLLHECAGAPVRTYGFDSIVAEAVLASVVRPLRNHKCIV